MSQFQWMPEGAPQLSSTAYSGEIIYLTKKAGEKHLYCRVHDFDILDTEVRAQLFAHAFGYRQKNVDFGTLPMIKAVESFRFGQEHISNFDMTHAEHDEMEGKHVSEPIAVENQVDRMFELTYPLP